MRTIIAAAVLATLLGVSAPAQAGANDCAFGVSPTVIDSAGPADALGSRLLQMWELAESPVWWSTQAPTAGPYADFRAKVPTNASVTDPRVLLERSPIRNSQIVLERAADWLAPASCLEMLLQAEQHARIDTFVAPTEFAAIVLRSADEARLRVYFYTVNQDGIGAMTPITDPVRADRKAGWTVVAALHNHAFHPGRPDLDGIPAPSVPDAGFQYNLAASEDLREAWITNGVHTARIPASAFGLFER